MRVVAQTTLFQTSGIVRVDFGESLLLMTVEATSLEAKTPAFVHFVALGALHIGDWRMLVKRREAYRRIRAGEIGRAHV